MLRIIQLDKPLHPGIEIIFSAHALDPELLNMNMFSFPIQNESPIIITYYAELLGSSALH